MSLVASSSHCWLKLAMQSSSTISKKYSPCAWSCMELQCKKTAGPTCKHGSTTSSNARESYNFSRKKFRRRSSLLFFSKGCTRCRSSNCRCSLQSQVKCQKHSKPSLLPLANSLPVPQLHWNSPSSSHAVSLKACFLWCLKARLCPTKLPAAVYSQALATVALVLDANSLT